MDAFWLIPIHSARLSYTDRSAGIIVSTGEGVLCSRVDPSAAVAQELAVLCPCVVRFSFYGGCFLPQGMLTQVS